MYYTDLQCEIFKSTILSYTIFDIIDIVSVCGQQYVQI